MSLWPDGEEAKDDGPESGREKTAPIISDLEQNGSYLTKEWPSYIYRIIPRIIRISNKPKTKTETVFTYINEEW
jgi:hypothetical protein